jgi:DNA polymerase (family 10)
MTNEEVANILDAIAELLEILGKNRFKAAAYRRAAQSVRMLSDPLSRYISNGSLEKIPGIGRSIGFQIRNAILTGKMPLYEALIERFPEELFNLLNVPGIGPKTAKTIYDNLGIKSVEELRQAVYDGSIRKVRGIGAKTVSKLKDFFKEGISDFYRLLLPDAEKAFQRFELELSRLAPSLKAVPAGSLRRRKETIGDIDLIVVSENIDEVNQILSSSNFFETVSMTDKNRLMARGKNGVNYDILVSGEASFGSSLVSFTGSREHLSQIKRIALQKGLVLEKGVLRNKDGKIVPLASEEEVYDYLGLQFIPPELREGWGEVQAAFEKSLPQLLSLSDIKGDIHVHSIWSDSSASIEEIAYAGAELGYEYIVVSDHAKRLRVARGLTIDEISERNEEIEILNRKLSGRIKILKGIELNIDREGGVDYPSELLEKFDLCIASLHWNLDMEEEEMTERLLRAMENPYVDVIGHPTTRLLPKRAQARIDFERVFKKALDTKTIFEINAFPDRLDLPPRLIKQAVQTGIKLLIGTDAHAVSHLTLMRHGVDIARKGWATKKDVLNTLSLEDFLKEIRERRSHRKRNSGGRL